MSRKYYVYYYRDFANTYELYWASTPEMEAALPREAEQISKKEAVRLCIAERERRKYDAAFSGYASTHICPADYHDQSMIAVDSGYKLNGYVWEPINA